MAPAPYSLGPPVETPSVRPLFGEVPLLTPRQQQIVKLVSQGLTNRQIAERLEPPVTPKTAKNMVSAIMHKLGVRNRTELAVYALQGNPRTDFTRVPFPPENRP